MADNVLVDEYHRIFFENYFCNFYKFEGRGQNLAKICNTNVSDNENRTDCCVMWSF